MIKTRRPLKIVPECYKLLQLILKLAITCNKYNVKINIFDFLIF